MTAALGSCAMCGKPAREMHHVTGRSPDRGRLDAALVVGLCLRHHNLIHQDLRVDGLDRPPRDIAWDAITAIRFRLDRCGLFLGRYSEFHDEPFWPLLANAHREWSTSLQEKMDNR